MSTAEIEVRPRFIDTIDIRVVAILSRDSGMSYHRVIKATHLTPNQFHWSVTGIDKLIRNSEPEIQKRLQEIRDDPSRMRELFRMEEGYLKEEYGRVIRTGENFIRGISEHPDNVGLLVYHALTYRDRKPRLKSALTYKPKARTSNRRIVLAEIEKLIKYGLEDYFNKVKLGGVMVNMHGLGNGKEHSPITFLKLFDRIYQRKTGDASLFDTRQSDYIYLGTPSGHAVRIHIHYH